MSKIEMKRHFEPAAIEAEENLVIDLQFLLQEVLSNKGMSRSELAKKLGISKARLSQIFSSEANPTVKSCARLFHALGEELAVTIKKESQRSDPLMGEPSEWEVELEGSALGDRKVNAKDVARLKETIGQNDNYCPQFDMWEGGEPIESQAA